MLQTKETVIASMRVGKGMRIAWGQANSAGWYSLYGIREVRDPSLKVRLALIAAHGPEFLLTVQRTADGFT